MANQSSEMIQITYNMKCKFYFSPEFIKVNKLWKVCNFSPFSLGWGGVERSENFCLKKGEHLSHAPQSKSFQASPPPHPSPRQISKLLLKLQDFRFLVVPVSLSRLFIPDCPFSLICFICWLPVLFVCLFFQCVFEVNPENGLTLVELWPGVPMQEVQVETGCQFEVS